MLKIKSVVAEIMINGSKPRKSVVPGVEVQSPLIIERRSKPTIFDLASWNANALRINLSNWRGKYVEFSAENFGLMEGDPGLQAKLFWLFKSQVAGSDKRQLYSTLERIIVVVLEQNMCYNIS